MSDLLHQFISGYHQTVRTLRREVLDATPGQWRLAADTVARLYIPPRDLIVEAREWCGVEGELVRRKDTATGAEAIVWIHGGGFVFGSPRTHRAAAAALAKATGRPVWLPDYPLAPEHPYPTALDALQRIDHPAPLDIVGDSAGGNLALSWALRRGAHDRMILLSPWLDLRVDGPSARRNASGHSAFDREDLREYAGLYLSGTAPTSADCSPILAGGDALRTLGPVLLEYSENEMLRDDSSTFADRCRETGLDLTETIEPDAPHGWQLFPDLLPEAKRSVERMRNFLVRPDDETPID